MSRKTAFLRASAALGVALSFGQAQARVVKFIVAQTRTFADGTSFGSVGQYQRLDGTAYFEVDPFDPAKANIVGLGEAPRNQRGMVAFVSQVFILKPADMGRGNGKIFYVNNNP